MPPKSEQLVEDKFNKGLDCRPGIVEDASGLDLFRELTNIIVTKDNNIRLRPPCVTMTGLVDPGCQGLILNNGQWYCVGPYGLSPNHTGQIAGFITTLFFNPPENVNATWNLLFFDVFEKQAIAYILHTFPGGLITSRLYLHVWDSFTGLPTYISDPYAPWDWGPFGFPVNAYGTNTNGPGSWQTFNPVTASTEDKLWSSRVDKNTGYSGIARARVFNTLSADDIESQGTMYYFTVPNTPNPQFAVPELYSDFSNPQNFAGYVLEQLTSTGAWSKIPEVLTIPTAGTWQLISGSRPWNASSVGVISTSGLPVDALIRLRIIISPAITIVSGGTLTPGPETYTGDGSTFNWPSTQPYASFIGDGTTVSVNGNVKPSTYYTVTNNNGNAEVNFDSFSQVTSGVLSLGSITPGSGYTSIPTLPFSGGTGGTGGSAVVNSLAAVSATPAAGGTGYAVNDIITVVGDTGTAATFKVLTLGASNAVASVAVNTGGALTTVAGNPHSTSGGTGAGCTLTVLYGIGVVTVTPGYGYVTAPTITVTGGGGTLGVVVLGMLAPVGVTAIPYLASIDGDFGRLSVYFNGLLQNEGVNYTLVNNGPNTTVLPAAPLAIGTTLNAQLIVPVGILIEFQSPNAVVGAATATFELNSVVTNAVLVSSLAPSSVYYVGISVNGSPAFFLTSATITGLQRYQLLIVGTVTTNLSGQIISTVPFQYGPQALTAWYNARHQNNLDYWSGLDEAGFLNSSTHDSSGTNITTMVAIKNRMLICYGQKAQLWQVDPNPANNGFLDEEDFGTAFPGVKFFDKGMIYSQAGFIAYNLLGISFQALKDIYIGEQINSIGTFALQAACFWPLQRAYVCFGHLTNCAQYAEYAELPADSPLWSAGGVYGFFYLTFSEESQIAAWSFHIVAGLTSVSKIIALNNRVYLLSGQQIWYFDTLNTTFLDGAQGAVAGAGTVSYRGDANWPLVPLGGSGSVRLLHMDMIKQGIVEVQVAVMPWNGGQEIPGPFSRYIEMGRLRVPLRCTGRAVAARLLTTDPAGMVLKSIRYEYMKLGR